MQYAWQESNPYRRMKKMDVAFNLLEKGSVCNRHMPLQSMAFGAHLFLRYAFPSVDLNL